MIRVLIIGNGNVASHLYARLRAIPSIHVMQINSRHIKDLPSADVNILAVSDDAISEVSSKFESGFVVHTSGAMHMNDLKNNGNKGVFYMLQSFTKEKEVDFSNVPFCLEAEQDEDLQVLKQLAKHMEGKIYFLDSDQRKALHVAAVFANNFSNYMFTIADSICEQNNIPFDILYPLIQETSAKVQTMPPSKAQTGPAIRRDQKTIKNHLNLLDDKQREIYTLITQSIQDGT